MQIHEEKEFMEQIHPCFFDKAAFTLIHTRDLSLSQTGISTLTHTGALFLSRKKSLSYTHTAILSLTHTWALFLSRTGALSLTFTLSLLDLRAWPHTQTRTSSVSPSLRHTKDLSLSHIHTLYWNCALDIILTHRILTHAHLLSVPLPHTQETFSFTYPLYTGPARVTTYSHTHTLCLSHSFTIKRSSSLIHTQSTGTAHLTSCSHTHNLCLFLSLTHTRSFSLTHRHTLQELRT